MTRSAMSATQPRPMPDDARTFPIGFLHLDRSVQNEATVGLLMLTDQTGLPLEFHLTNKVQPTGVQRALYGRRLREHIAVQLCGRTLLPALKTRPQLLLVRLEELMGVQKYTDVPVFQLVPAPGNNAPPTLISASPAKAADCLQGASLHPDMVDAFDRMIACRKSMAEQVDAYRI